MGQERLDVDGVAEALDSFRIRQKTLKEVAYLTLGMGASQRSGRTRPIWRKLAALQSAQQKQSSCGCGCLMGHPLFGLFWGDIRSAQASERFGARLARVGVAIGRHGGDPVADKPHGGRVDLGRAGAWHMSGAGFRHSVKEDRALRRAGGYQARVVEAEVALERPHAESLGFVQRQMGRKCDGRGSASVELVAMGAIYMKIGSRSRISIYIGVVRIGQARALVARWLAGGFEVTEPREAIELVFAAVGTRSIELGGA
jgi:hypothetical protein